jgi:sugar O-acyltransferase (sialic acid O-acetyltransferase NeuD family)
MEKDVLVIGTGGHARVVAEILRAGGRPVAGFVVPPKQPPPQPPLAHARVLEWEEACRLAERYAVVVGIGDNLLRQEKSEEAAAAGFQFATAVHPAAVIGRGVELGPGTVVGAGAILVLEVSVGRGVIVNTGAHIDHDCRIGDWCHVGPGAVLAGSVTLGEGVLVGAGGVIINNVTIGRYSTVGAGGVVVRDIPERVVAVGVPASILRDGER